MRIRIHSFGQKFYKIVQMKICNALFYSFNEKGESMLAVERRNLILEKLHTDKRVIVSDLSGRFGVSDETIRRDLIRLEQKGLIVKSYGGAVLNESNSESSFYSRQKKNVAGKKVIADIIKDLVYDGDHIVVDASTTALSIVNALSEKDDLTLITNSIEVMFESMKHANWDVVSTGGKLYEKYLAFAGPGAMMSFKTMNADKMIFSCKGFDMNRGITDGSAIFALLKNTMLKSVKETILAVDHTKFDQIAFYNICDVADVDVIVTDICPSDEWMAYFKEKGMKCLYGNEKQENF